jgi:hypothetical protein
MSNETTKKPQANIMTPRRVNKYRGKSLNDYSLLKKSVWEQAHQLTSEDKLKFINNLKKDLETETKLEKFQKTFVVSIFDKTKKRDQMGL